MIFSIYLKRCFILVYHLPEFVSNPWSLLSLACRAGVPARITHGYRKTIKVRPSHAMPAIPIGILSIAPALCTAWLFFLEYGNIAKKQHKPCYVAVRAHT